MQRQNNKPEIIKISYRPFDIRFSAYTGFSSGFMGRPRNDTMRHMIHENLAISSTRSRRNDASCYFITQNITDKSISSSLDNNYIFPLYLYNDTTQNTLDKQAIRTPNLNQDIVEQIASKIGLSFTDEKENINGTFAPIDLLDYIYAVLHSPKYRETYKEFLKIDFPRVPYPTHTKTFIELVKLGGELRRIHLLESPSVEQYITQYPEDGSNIVEKPIYKHGNVYINDTQYFANVPEVAWTFYIGGYQPAQKWLKDRKDRALDFEDILHYQKIIVALTETNRIMQEIDTVLVEI